MSRDNCLATRLAVLTYICLMLIAPPLSAGESRDLGLLWQDLAAQDGDRAFAAIWALCDRPDEAVALLKKNLTPVVLPLAQLLDDLQSETFAVRQKASQELEALGELAAPALRKAQGANKSLELERRVEALLKKMNKPIRQSKTLRELRALEVLELLATADARVVLEQMAKGTPAGLLTEEAKKSLSRLARRPVGLNPRTAPVSPIDVYADSLPAGAVARVGTSRWRQGDMERTFFAPDGRSVIGVSPSRLSHWDAANGKLLRAIEVEDMHVHSALLSADGKYLAVAGILRRATTPGAIRIWDWATAKPLHTLEVKDLGSIQFGARAVMGFADDNTTLVYQLGGVLLYWNLQSGREVRRVVLPGDLKDRRLVLSPDAKMLAAAGGQGFIYWDCNTSNPPRKLAIQTALEAVSFAPDSKMVALASYGITPVGLWDLASSRKVMEFVPPSDSDSVRSLAIAPDGQSLVLVSSGHGPRALVCWDRSSGKIRWQVGTGGDNLGQLAFAPDSQRVVAPTESMLRMWEMRNGDEIGPVKAAPRSWIIDFAFTPDNQLLVTAGDDQAIRFWEPATGNQRRLVAYEGRVRALALSPDGKHLASSSLDDTVRLWDTATGQEVFKLRGHGQTGNKRRLLFGTDGKQLASWGDDYRTRIWDVQTGQSVAEHAFRPKDLDEDPDGGGIAAYRIEKLLNSSDASFSPDGKQLAWQLKNQMHLFDVMSGKEQHVLSTMGVPFSSGLAINPNGDLALVGAGDKGSALVWLPSGVVVGFVAKPRGFGRKIAFSPDGRSFAIGSLEAPGKIHIYETASLAERTTIETGSAFPIRLAFSPHGRWLASALNDTSLLVWDLARIPRK